jgi:hypothetical protein
MVRRRNEKGTDGEHERFGEGMKEGRNVLKGTLQDKLRRHEIDRDGVE